MYKGNSRVYMGLLGIKGFSWCTRVYKGLQGYIEGFTRDYKGFPRITEDYNGMQGCNGLQGFSRDYRG